MARKRPGRDSKYQSLMSRLAALENVSVSSPADYDPPPIRIKQKRRSLAFFVLGFACAMLFGVLAIAILLIVSPEPARANTLTHAATPSPDRLPVTERRFGGEIPDQNRM